MKEGSPAASKSRVGFKDAQKREKVNVNFLLYALAHDYFLKLNIQSPVIKSLLHVLERKILGHIEHIQRVARKYTL